MQETSVFVLAGGRSVRMGTDKAFLKLGAHTLLERALALAQAVSPAVYIVGSRQRFAEFGVVVEDIFSDQGPLGGIHAGLRASPTELNLILAVDMPFVEVRFLRYLLECAQARVAAVVTVPRACNGWQPLCAAYRKSFADVAEAALAAGRNKIDLLFAKVDICVLEESELAQLGFLPTMFRNLNTPEEAEAARG